MDRIGYRITGIGMPPQNELHPRTRVNRVQSVSPVCYRFVTSRCSTRYFAIS
jgi:hypothetical protein